jgi:hypothetical protein
MAMEQELTEEEDRGRLVLEESSADEEEIEVNEVNTDGYHLEDPNREQEITRENEESGLPLEERPIRAQTISQATYQR